MSCQVVKKVLVLLVLVTMVGTFGAAYGCAPEEQAVESKPASKQPEPREAPSDPSPPEGNNSRPDSENPAEVAEAQTPTVEERIRSKVNRAFGVPEESVKQIGTRQHKRVGCYIVTVDFYENTMDAIEWSMEDIYAALYKDPQLAGEVCNVTVNAYGDIRSVGSRKWHKEKVYSTTLSLASAKTANWKKDLGVNTYSANNLKGVWRTNFIHPAIKQVKKQEQARERLKRRIDCLEDRGLFDVDALCP
jgi:hypothetical protein